MTTIRNLTMKAAETRLVEVHDFDRSAARALLRRMAEHARHSEFRVACYDADTFSLSYSLLGAHYGRGHFEFLED